MHRPCYFLCFGYPRHLNCFFWSSFWPAFSFPFLLLGWHVAFVGKWEIRVHNFHRKVSWDPTSQMSCERMNWVRLVYTKTIIWWRHWTLVFYNGRRNSGLRNFIRFNKNCIIKWNVISLTRLVALLSGGHLWTEYWFRLSSHLWGSPDQVSNYQFTNKDPASPPFLKFLSVLHLRTGLHSVLRIFTTASLSFSRWSFFFESAIFNYLFSQLPVRH